MKIVSFKVTRKKHESGYRRLHVTNGKEESDCADVIWIRLPDGSEIRMDSKDGNINIFSNYYDFKIDDFNCSDLEIKAIKRKE